MPIIHTNYYTTVVIGITNIPAAGETITNTLYPLQGTKGTNIDIRTWATGTALPGYPGVPRIDTSVVNPATGQTEHRYTPDGTKLLIGSSIAECATNLDAALSAFPFVAQVNTRSGNAITLKALPGKTLTIGVASDWNTNTTFDSIAYWSTTGATNDFAPLETDNASTIAFRQALSMAQMANLASGAGIQVAGISLTASNLTVNASTNVSATIVGTLPAFTVNPTVIPAKGTNDMTILGVSPSAASPLVVSNVAPTALSWNNANWISGISNAIASAQWLKWDMNITNTPGMTLAGQTARIDINGTNQFSAANPMIVSNVAPGGTISLPSGSTNGSGQLIVVAPSGTNVHTWIDNPLNNNVAVTNTLSIGFADFTNATYHAGVTSLGQILVSQGASDKTVDSITAWPGGTFTNQSGGFTLVTNLTLTNYLGTDLIAGDVLNTNAIQIANVARSGGPGTAILLGATYISSTNLALQAIDMLVCSQPITWPTASAAANLTQTELPYIQGVMTFGTNLTAQGTEWTAFGSNQVCSVTGKSIGLKPATNTIFLYFKTRVAITNSANDIIKLTISQD